MKKLCMWCNEPHLFGTKTLDADPICNKCLKHWKTDIPNIKVLLSNLSTKNTQHFFQFCTNAHDKFLQFKTTRKVANYLCIDEEKKLWFVPNLFGDNKIAYSYEDIKSIEILKDSITQTSGNSRGALLGSILFGAEGAIIGSAGKKVSKQVCDSLKIKIILNNFFIPNVFITFWSEKEKNNTLFPGRAFQKAFTHCHDCFSLLSSMAENS